MSDDTEQVGDQMETSDNSSPERTQSPKLMRRLRRDDVVDAPTLQTRSSKQTSKTKIRQKPLVLDLQYGNKPSGPSSFSNFAGLDDDMVAYQNDTAAGDAGVTPATDEAVDLPLGAVPDSWEDRYDDFDREPMRDKTNRASNAFLEGGPVFQPAAATIPVASDPVPTDQEAYIPWSSNDGSRAKYAAELYVDFGMIGGRSPPYEDLRGSDDGGLWDESFMAEAATQDDRVDEAVSVEFYEAEVQRLKEESLNAKTAAENAKKAQQFQVDQLKAELDQLDAELKKSRVNHQSEQQKSTNEKRRFVEEVENLKEKIRKLETELTTKTEINEHLLTQMENLRKHHCLMESTVDAAMNGPCKCKINVKEFQQRAQIAEASLIRLKSQVELRTLEKARRDGEYILVHLSSIIGKASKDDGPRLQEYKRLWELNLRELELIIDGVKKKYDEQIRQVESGVSLSSLSPVDIPRPPPPPMPPTKPTVNTEMMKSPSPVIPSAPVGLDRSQIGNVVNTSPLRPPTVRHPTAPSVQPIAGLRGSTPAMSSGFVRPTVPLRFPSVQSNSVQPPPGFQPGSNMQPNFGALVNERAAIAARMGLNPTAQTNALFRPISTPPVPSSPLPRTTAPTDLQPRVQTNAVIGNGGGASAAAAQRSEGGQKLEKLTEVVREQYPHLTRDNVVVAICAFRGRTPNKTLKDVPYADLVAGVCQVSLELYPRSSPEPLVAQSPTKLVSYQAASSYVGSPAPLQSQRQLVQQLQPIRNVEPARAPLNAAPVVMPSQPIQRPQSGRQEEECFVCLELLSRSQVLVMDCGHRAHDNCLQQWFKTHKSCPVCRSLALPPDEYPAL